MLKVRNIVSGYSGRPVLKNLSLHVSRGEIVAIIGANGAGKTTLLNSIAGLIKPDEGEILLNNTVLQNKCSLLSSLGCALVPEGRSLFPSMTVKENLILGAYANFSKEKKQVIFDRLDSINELFPRLKERYAQSAGSLSGGEQQMLAIGRALMSNPSLIMLDEPSMGLAPLVIKSIFDTLKKLKQDGKTILVVEQNARAILKIADRGYVMENGSLLFSGTSEELLQNNDVQRAYLGKEYSSIAE